ncbi:hypothetical protein [Sphingobacterium composti Ten et al. 2007 non Yoo et al. 2007]|uniref:hypothetical protein n=1 Tax=Sphingobacterium composti TaxID=363260 RepID=UPI0013587D2B|nr:hypothetical protein [Sphingobacterium composti Ten et al. 2007 non Yoo et al. 2007]
MFNNHDLRVYLNIDKKETVVKDARQLHLESHYEYFITELRRVGVTRQLLWQEYIFEYRMLLVIQDSVNFYKIICVKVILLCILIMSQGKLLEIDFAGDKLHYVDTSTGKLNECPVFVAVLPYSGY